MDFDGADYAQRTGVVTGPPTTPTRPGGTGTPPAPVAAHGAPSPPVPAPIRPARSASATALAPVPVTGTIASPSSPPDTASVPAKRRRHGLLAFIWRWMKRLVLLALLLLTATLGLMLLYRYVDPPTTPTLAVRTLLGEPVDQRWRPLPWISPALVRAVVASEDARFCSHAGIDYGELRAAIEDTMQGRPRGGSTITMQVVKNLFLWPSRSVVRKAIELPLALALEVVWPKQRIIEVYLNIAEWGPGIYGAEAAARNLLDKPASRLTNAEATRLAVSLPNPAARDAGDPSRTVARLASRLEVRIRRGVSLQCLRLR